MNPTPSHLTRRILAAAAAATTLLACLAPTHAQTVKTWTGANGDFYTAANWDTASVPGATDIATINNAGMATIAANAGDRELGSIKLGTTPGSTESGHIIMNGGFIRLSQNPGDPKVNIGEGTVLSTFIMNGGTIYFDWPDRPDIAGSRSGNGINGLDWEVGERGLGRFEMHGGVFRIADDLKVAENAAGNGYAIIDGTSILSTGSGISVSSGGENEQILIIGGNARVDSGNSMGAGSPEGHTDEGYVSLTIGGANSRGTLTVQDNAILTFQVLSSRAGITKFTIKNNAQVHIFDVLTGNGNTPADRPTVTPAFRNSLSSGPETDSTLTIQDNAQMTINAVNGLGISGPRGSADPGGKALMIVRDSATFRIEQFLALGTGTQAATSDGTLEVRGPDAKINIGENLNMAVDPDGNVPTNDLTDPNGNPLPGRSTLHAVITSATHSTVNVAGIARIGNGRLKVTLDGFKPNGGEVFTLIRGGTIEGQFMETDLTAAPLLAGLSWEVEYAADAVRLKVAGQSVVPTIKITNIKAAGNALELAWEGGTGPFMVQKKITLADNAWVNMLTTTEHLATIAKDGDTGFYRIADNAQTQVTAMSVGMSGGMERPAVSTIASGFGSISVEGNTLNINLAFNGLSAAPIGAHIHGPAAAAENGPVMINLMSLLKLSDGSSVGGLHPATPGGATVSGTITGSLTLTDQQRADILAGRTYVNIHTPANPGGEIRGQMMPIQSAVLLSGGSEQPLPVKTKGYGAGTLELVGNELTFDVGYTDLSGAAIAAHIHGPSLASTAGGVMINLAPFNGGAFGTSGRLAGTVTLTAEQLAAVIDGQAYFNIHTANNGGGEIRGQINGAQPPIGYSAALHGGAERPGVQTTANGFATLTLDSGTLTFHIAYNGLSGVATGAHIHGPASAGENGPVVINLEAFNGGAFGTSGTIQGSVAVNAATAAALRTGMTYVNIHTAANSGGEIRGQVVPVNHRVSLAGSAEVPPVTTPARGSGSLTLIGRQLTFSVAYAGLSGAATGAHLHAAPVGVNGPVIVNLEPFNGGAFGTDGGLSGTVVLNDEALAALADGLVYLNIHTAANAGGEIRGQIGAFITATPFTSVLSGDSEVPPVTTSARGFGQLAIEGNTLLFEVLYQGLSGAAIGAHIHGPAAAGGNGPVLISLEPFHAGPFATQGIMAGVTLLTAAQKDAILSGQAYLNIHTAANPGGEIRGQIAHTRRHALLSGNAEVPPVVTTGGGAALFGMVGRHASFHIAYHGLSGAATGAHIHGPSADTATGPVLIDLEPFNGGSFGATGTIIGNSAISTTDFTHIVNNLTYVNIHTASKPGGEIRGQVLP
jgi:hypothetical protein